MCGDICVRLCWGECRDAYYVKIYRIYSKLLHYCRVGIKLIYDTICHTRHCFSYLGPSHTVLESTDTHCM